jgi:hypothetical protein
MGARLAAFVDWLADPHGRVYKWLALAGMVLAILTGIVSLFNGSSDDSPPVPQPSILDVSAEIPVIEAEIGHLTPDEAALALEEHFTVGAVMELHLLADAARVYSDSTTCIEGSLSACRVTWAVECDGGYKPPYAPNGQWPKDWFIADCPKVWSLHTVTKQGEDDGIWYYQHGALTLDGFFVVEGKGYAQGIQDIFLREIPPEVAKQLLR